MMAADIYLYRQSIEIIISVLTIIMCFFHFTYFHSVFAHHALEMRPTFHMNQRKHRGSVISVMIFARIKVK